jgi:hypothetical protein
VAALDPARQPGANVGWARADVLALASFVVAGCYLLYLSDAPGDEKPEPAPPARTASSLPRQGGLVDRLWAYFAPRWQKRRSGGAGQHVSQARMHTGTNETVAADVDDIASWLKDKGSRQQVARLKRALAEKEIALELQQRSFEEQAEKTQHLEQEVQRDVALLRTAAAQRAADASKIQSLSVLNKELDDVVREMSSVVLRSPKNPDGFSKVGARGRESAQVRAEEWVCSANGNRWHNSPDSIERAVFDLGDAWGSYHDLAFPAQSGSASPMSTMTHNSVAEVLVGEQELVVKPGASTRSSQVLLQLIEDRSY